MKMNRLILFIVLLLSSCSHSIHQVDVGDFSPYKKFTSGKAISGSAEQTSFMGLSFETNYFEEARKELISKCPKGQIQGIVTRYSTSHGFFHWVNKIHMDGVCIASK